MPAYLVIDSVVHDPETMAHYVAAAGPIITAHGGEHLTRGSSKVTPFGGGWDAQRIVIIRFPDAAALRACFASPEYAAIAHLRQAAVTGRSVIVEAE